MLERATPQRVAVRPLVDGAPAGVTAATVALRDEDNREIVAPVACVVAGDGTVSADITIPAATPYGDRYALLWVYQIAGRAYPDRGAAMVVRYRLPCPLTDEDIAQAAPPLDRAQRGAVTARAAYADMLDEAWIQIQTRLIQDGNRPNRILDASALRTAALHLTLALIFDALTSRQGEGYAETADRHRTMFEHEYARVKVQYAPDDPAGIETTKRGPPASVILGGAGGSRRGETGDRAIFAGDRFGRRWW